MKYKRGSRVKSDYFICPLGHLHKYGGYNCKYVGVTNNVHVWNGFWKIWLKDFKYIPIKDGIPVCYNPQTHVHTVN